MISDSRVATDIAVLVSPASLFFFCHLVGEFSVITLKELKYRLAI